MDLINYIRTMPENKVAELYLRVKKMIDDRDKFYSKYRQDIYGNFVKKNQQGNSWTKGRTMKKIYSVPMDVYMSNPPYWDEIIKTKQFSKHPEWIIK
jgi:hypothetical protein